MRPAQASPEFGAEAFFEENDDVQPAPRGITRHAPAERLAIFFKLGAPLRQYAAHTLVGFLARQSFVEGAVVEVTRSGGGDKGDRAVVGQFVQGSVTADMGGFEVNGESER